MVSAKIAVSTRAFAISRSGIWADRINEMASGLLAASKLRSLRAIPSIGRGDMAFLFFTSVKKMSSVRIIAKYSV